MERGQFQTVSGVDVPGVTADEMREIDRIAMDDVGLSIEQMMENAGRALAWHVREFSASEDRVLVVAGDGGNGGGGLICARHLANRDVPVEVLLDRPPAELSGATKHQLTILQAMSIPIHSGENREVIDLKQVATIVDSLIGYGLQGDVRGNAKQIVERMNRTRSPVLSLDVPSGVDATTGETRGVSVDSVRTVTLALPKTGLRSWSSELFLAAIGIPAVVFEAISLDYEAPFEDEDWVRLRR